MSKLGEDNLKKYIFSEIEIPCSIFGKEIQTEYTQTPSTPLPLVDSSTSISSMTDMPDDFPGDFNEEMFYKSLYEFKEDFSESTTTLENVRRDVFHYRQQRRNSTTQTKMKITRKFTLITSPQASPTQKRKNKEESKEGEEFVENNSRMKSMVQKLKKAFRKLTPWISSKKNREEK